MFPGESGLGSPGHQQITPLLREDKEGWGWRDFHEQGLLTLEGCCFILAGRAEGGGVSRVCEGVEHSWEGLSGPIWPQIPQRRASVVLLAGGEMSTPALRGQSSVSTELKCQSHGLTGESGERVRVQRRGWSRVEGVKI